MKKRLIEFDILKGILVLFVLFIHLLSNVINSYHIADIIGWMLPLFFLVSGYFIKYDPLKKQLSKRLLSVVIPFTIYFVIFTIVVGTFAICQKSMTFNDLTRSVISELLGKPFLDLCIPNFYLKTELHTPMTVFWFYIQFILAVIITLPLLKLINNSRIKGTITIVILLSLSCISYIFNIDFPFYINMTLFEVALMIFGNILGNIKIHEKLYNLKLIYKLLICIFSLLIAMTIGYFNPRLSFMSHGELGSLGCFSPLVAFIDTSIGFIGLLLLCKALSNLKVASSFIGYFGENMMDIVFIHMFVGWLLLKIFNVPLALNFCRSEEYISTIEQNIMLFGSFALNQIICFVIIRIKALVSQAIKNN